MSIEYNPLEGLEKENGRALESVREIFGKLKREEITKKDKGETFDPHLIDFDAESVDLSGARLWEDYQKLENANQAESLLKLCGMYADAKRKESGSSQTDNFSAYLINKVNAKFYEFLIAEHEKGSQNK